MVIYTAHLAGTLVETDIIESVKTGAGYRANSVVWHKKILLPAHKQRLSLGKGFVVEVRATSLLCEISKGGKAPPVLHVDSIVGAPRGVLGNKGVFGADDLPFEVGCEDGKIVGQA